jgi:hypothetical protein
LDKFKDICESFDEKFNGVVKNQRKSIKTFECKLTKVREIINTMDEFAKQFDREAFILPA